MMKQYFRNERGDTLIEVTLALAILALVLTSAFATANKAFLLGQNAKERNQLVSDAQQQAEALISFRDSYSWTQFQAGNALTGLPGINVRNTGGGCASPCFHMVQRVISGLNQWVPQTGPGTDSQIGGQGYLRIYAAAVVGYSGYDFTIQYGIPARGGGPDLSSIISLRLTDEDALRR